MTDADSSFLGPFLWQPGTQSPVENKFAWSKMTNMLWIEQPVSTGFAQGEVRAENEFDVAKDFLGFFKNWQKLFMIEDYKIYMTVRKGMMQRWCMAEDGLIEAYFFAFAGRVIRGKIYPLHCQRDA